MIMMGGDKKKMASIIVGADVADRNREEYEERAGEPDGDSLHYAASDLMKAFHAKDVVALKEALQSFFEICDSMPHSEGEHLE